MNNEVRYAYLRPEQIISRRKACPVAYIPIGTLEWHGFHCPVGTDTLQAEGLAIRCAEKGGGLVFPPLYYGESRLDSLMEAMAVDKKDIARGMDLDPANFSPDRMPFSAMEQSLNYQKLLIHILAQADTLGFKVGVLVAGHYPLIDHARSAVLQYHQRRLNKYHQMIAWTFVDYLLINQFYEFAGDHAGCWETSHMMALHPETVDLDVLPEKGEPLTGVMGRTLPQDATPEYGEETLEKAAEIAICEVQDRLSHPDRYRSHGTALQEGLWRQT